MTSLIEHCPFWWLHHVPALRKQAEARPQAARRSPIRSERHPQWKCCPRAFSIFDPPYPFSRLSSPSLLVWRSMSFPTSANGKPYVSIHLKPSLILLFQLRRMVRWLPSCVTCELPFILRHFLPNTNGTRNYSPNSTPPAIPRLSTTRLAPASVAATRSSAAQPNHTTHIPRFSW